MIPIAPNLAVRPLEDEDTPALLALINQQLTSAPYSLPMDGADLLRQVLAQSPQSWYETRWTGTMRLGVWRAGEMVGFLDGGAGHDGDSLEVSEYEPHGLVRFLALSERSDVADAAFALLLSSAEESWRGMKIRRLVAWHISTGYPSFQAGAGILPGDWSAMVRLFTAADWQLSERYYALVRPLGSPLEEVSPLGDLGLAQQRLAQGRIYRAYHRRTELVAHARVMGMRLDRAGTVDQVAHLVNITVEEVWRNRNLGRWLLRRLINDATLQGYREMVAFVPMSRPLAMNLLVQHGFQEINYRGYTLEKRLRA